MSAQFGSITTGKVEPLEIPANALPKPYVGQAVVAAMRTFENMGLTGTGIVTAR